MTVALMWEAKAADGRGTDLLDWARGQELGTPPLRRETFSAPGGRVLVITWWSADFSASLPELPEPPPELIARSVHRWRFEQV